MRLQIGVCETSLSDVMAPEVHQTITLCQWTYFRFTAQVFSMVGGYTEDLKKTYLSKLKGGHVHGDGHLHGTRR